MASLRALLLAATAGGACAQFQLKLMKNHVADGALCLDGSPAGYYLHAGDPAKWIVAWQGGGWCWDELDCLSRANSSLGSSKFWAAAAKFGGLLDVVPGDNPQFHNYSMVLVPYCDGASFSGDVADPVVVNGTPLYMRGHRIMDAVLADLLSMPNGLTAASELLVNGGSAGGLTTYLHIDYIAAAVRAANPGIAVAAVPDCGFFLADAADVFGRAYALGQFQYVAAMQNVTASPDRVNADCWAATPPALRWQCFIAHYTYPHIKTRIFTTNSQYDTWQLGNIWAPLGDMPSPAVYASYAACIAHPLTACNASQYASLQGYHVQLQGALNMSLAASPVAAAQNGFFVTSCLQHGELEEGLWNVISIGGLTLRDAIGEWYFQTKGAGGGQYWTLDAPYPGNPTCP